MNIFTNSGRINYRDRNVSNFVIFEPWTIEKNSRRSRILLSVIAVFWEDSRRRLCPWLEFVPDRRDTEVNLRERRSTRGQNILI